MEIRNATKSNELIDELEHKATKGRKGFIIGIASFTIVAMIASGIVGYVYCTNSINSRYSKMISVVIGKDGTTIDTLAKAFMPDLNFKKATEMIMKVNGFVDSREYLKRGEVIKIPTKEIENPVLAKPFIIKSDK